MKASFGYKKALAMMCLLEKSGKEKINKPSLINAFKTTVSSDRQIVNGYIQMLVNNKLLIPEDDNALIFHVNTDRLQGTLDEYELTREDCLERLGFKNKKA